MAFSLNLYHEILSEQMERKRDPLKLGLAALGIVVLGFAAYGSLRWSHASGQHAALAATEREWRDLQPKIAEAKGRKTEVEKLLEASKAIDMLKAGRVSWASALALLFRTIPPEVQLRTFQADSTLTVPKDPSAKPVLSVWMVLGGLAAGPEPRTVAEDLRKALAAAFEERYPGVRASFSNNQLNESEETVRLNGEELPTVTFNIRIEATREIEIR